MNEAARVTFLHWSPEFDLGVPEIDGQHRRLFVHVNTFAEAFLAGTGATEAMGQLLDDAVAHFDFEEALMRHTGFAGAMLHAEQHSELLASMARLHARLARDQHGIDRPKTLDFLREWFSLHIVMTDAELARFLKAQTAPGLSA